MLVGETGTATEEAQHRPIQRDSLPPREFSDVLGQLRVEPAYGQLTHVGALLL